MDMGMRVKINYGKNKINNKIMKRIVGFFIVLVLSMGVYSVVAQNEQNDQSNDQNALRQFVEKSNYGKNWFVSLGGDANLLAAEQDEAINMKKRVKFGGDLTVGKWFSPDFGARIQVMGGSLRGFNYADDRGGYYVIDNYHHLKTPMGLNPGGRPITYDEDHLSNHPILPWVPGMNGFWQDFNYATATFDVMANFTNLMRGYDTGHNRIDVIPLIGLGWIHAFSNHTTTPRYDHFALKIGVRVNFNLNDHWAIYLEPQGTATTKEFDGYAGDNFGDGIANVGLGVQYTFSKRFNSMSQLAQLTADEIDRLNNKINDNRYRIDNQQNMLERQQNLLDRLQRCCDDNKKQVITQVVETTTTASLPAYVRFALDSYKIESTEHSKIEEAADFLKKNPNSKLLIVGYADRKTGNPPYNMTLSQKRVNAVAAELKNLGVNENRIVSEWKGDKVQPFPENEWNRVVVMVERK